MIKKRLRKHRFNPNDKTSIIERWEASGLLDGLMGLTRTPFFDKSPTVPMMVDDIGGIMVDNNNHNEFQVRLDVINHTEPQFIIEADGDARLTGRMHALGSLIYNTYTNRIEFWDGVNWNPLPNNVNIS